MTPTEVIERLYAALQAGDIDGLLEWLSENVLIIVPGPPRPGRRRRLAWPHGRARVLPAASARDS